METKRASAIRTRNHRLSALHAFFRYLQVEAPERLVQCQQILAIPLKRCPRTAVNYLLKEDLSTVLSQPNLTIIDGRRDAVLLSVLYDTGSRVQELIDLRVSDVRLETPAQIRLTGKGKKTRVVPLLSRTVDLLAEYMQEQKLDRVNHPDFPLFSKIVEESIFLDQESDTF